MVGLAQVLCWFLVLSSIGVRITSVFDSRRNSYHSILPASIPVIIHGYQTRGPIENCQLQSGLVMQTVCLEGSHEEQPQRFRSMSLDRRWYGAVNPLAIQW